MAQGPPVEPQGPLGPLGPLARLQDPLAEPHGPKAQEFIFCSTSHYLP